MDFRSILTTLFLPVAWTFFLIQIAIYVASSCFNILHEDDVLVSWVKVIDELQVWRLVIAHHCHFTLMHLSWSLVALMTIGRCLEQKLTKIAMIVLINLNGIVSNTIFVYLNLVMCPPEQGLKLSDFSYGFTNLTLGFRVILAYIQEPRNYEADVLYGLFPVVLPASWAPWQPFLEIIILKISAMEICVAYPISSTLSGLLLSHLARLFPHEWVFLAKTNETDEDCSNNSNCSNSSDSLNPILSVEVLRAIQTNRVKNNPYTNNNGIIRSSFAQQNALLNRSLGYQLKLHQHMQQEALRKGGRKKWIIVKSKTNLS